LQPPEAAHEEPGADEQHERQRHLRHHEHIARRDADRVVDALPSDFIIAATSDRAAWSAGAAPNTRLVSSETPNVNASTVPSISTSARRGSMPSPTARTGDQQVVPEHEPGDTGSHAEQEALGEQLPDESRATRAERGAYRHLATSRGCACEQETRRRCRRR
jgi:hypothetical protein